MADGKSVLKLPRLPGVPSPPSLGRDPRQQQFIDIVGALDDATKEAGVSLASIDIVSGFHAARVDLADLKAALETCIAEFTMDQLRTRWEDDVCALMQQVIGSWVQRRKEVRLRLRDNGIRVEMQTQDDMGYYNYGFDVFPGR